MLQEIELIYWYHLMKTYLSKLNGEARFSEESVQLFFFQAGVFVKKFLQQTLSQKRGRICPEATLQNNQE